MKKLSISLAMLLAIGCTSLCQGQNQVDPLPAENIIPGVAIEQVELGQMLNSMLGQMNKKQREKVISTMKDRAKERVALRTEYIDRVCSLSEKQKKRLELAGKGVVQKTFSKLLKNVPKKGKANGNDPGFGEIPMEAFGGDEAMLFVDDMMTGAHLFRLDKNEFWKRQVAKVLDDKQKTALKTANQRQQNKLFEASVQLATARLGRNLYLSDKQQEKLTEILKKKYKKVINTSNSQDIFYGSSFIPSILSRGDKDILNILTKNQRKILERKMKQMGAFAGPGGINPAVELMNVLPPVENEIDNNR